MVDSLPAEDLRRLVQNVRDANVHDASHSTPSEASVLWARQLFHKLFSEDIKQLLEEHPAAQVLLEIFRFR